MQHFQHVPNVQEQQQVQAHFKTLLRKARPSFLVQWLKPPHEIRASYFHHPINSPKFTNPHVCFHKYCTKQTGDEFERGAVPLSFWRECNQPQAHKQNRARSAWSSHVLGQNFLFRWDFSALSATTLKPVWRIQEGNLLMTSICTMDNLIRPQHRHTQVEKH